ncbi:Conserved oligomeric Golgi complex subunit 2, partial [Dispira simplex]
MGMTPAVGSRFPRPFVFSEYLIQHPRYGLKDFLDELSSHEAHLGNELVTLVNQEYPSFIELVKGLQGVREELHPLEENCQETCAPLSDVRAQLDQYLNQLERGMARRTAIRDQRQALQRMLQVAQSIEQVESWLESLTTTVMAPHNGLPVTSTFTPSPI